MDKECQHQIELLVKGVAQIHSLEVLSVNLLTNHNPITIQIKIKNIDNSDISIENCVTAICLLMQ